MRIRLFALLGAALLCLATNAAVRSGAGAATPPHVPAFAHIVVVMEENHSYADIIGNKSAPYINSLATHGAKFTNSYAITHPSEPNYLALFSGSTHGLAADTCPLHFTGNSLGQEVLDAKKTFAGYSEGLPTQGSTVCTSGSYARKHVPWTDFSLPTSTNKRWGQFPSTYSHLPRLSFVIPDLDHDMHNGTIAQADSWLKDHLNAYVTWARTHNSILVLTWDEDDHSANNRIPTIIVGAHVRVRAYTEHINHYSVLRTIEDSIAVRHVGAAQTATSITNIWTS